MNLIILLDFIKEMQHYLLVIILQIAHAGIFYFL